MLYLLVAGGLYGALWVSYKTITGIAPCPHVQGIPICFVVAAGYSTMLMGLFLSHFPGKKVIAKNIFLTGWFLVFSIAATGTLFEFMIKGTCPVSSSGSPLCYLSLAITLVIIIVFIGSRSMSIKPGGKIL